MSSDSVENAVTQMPKQSDATIDTPKERSFFLTSLPFFVLAHATHHLLTALPQPMLPFMQEEFKLNYAKTGAITSAFAVSSGASQLPAGWLADRMGPTYLITMGILGVAIGGLFVGLSQSYIMLLASLVFMGLMAGGYHPASTPLISLSVPVNQRGRALGIHLVGGTLSFGIAPYIAGILAGVWGWRGSYLTLAIPTAILGIFFFIYLNRKYGEAHVEAMKRKKVEEHPPQPGYQRRLIAYLIMMVIGGGAGFSVHAFLTPYMVDVLGLAKENAAKALSIVFLISSFASPLGGYLSDKLGSAKVIIVTGILGGLVIFVLKEVPLGWGWWTVLAVMGLIQGIRFPVTEVFIMSQSPAKHRSTIYGIYYTTMQYTGAVFAPIIGWVIDAYGFYNMFSLSAYVVTAVAVVTALFIWDARD